MLRLPSSFNLWSSVRTSWIQAGNPAQYNLKHFCRSKFGLYTNSYHHYNDFYFGDLLLVVIIIPYASTIYHRLTKNVLTSLVRAAQGNVWLSVMRTDLLVSVLMRFPSGLPTQSISTQWRSCRVSGHHAQFAGVFQRERGCSGGKSEERWMKSSSVITASY